MISLQIANPRGAGLAVRILKALPKMAYILAFEMAYIAQAAAIRKTLSYIPSKVPVSKEIQKSFDGLQTEICDINNPLYLDIQVTERVTVKQQNRKRNQAGESVLEEVSRLFPPVKEDCHLSTRLGQLADLISNGEIVRMASRFFQLHP